MNSSLKNYFFAGVTAALALLFVSWQMGYSANLQKLVFTSQSQLPKETKSIVGKIVTITDTTLTIFTTDSTGSTRNAFTNAATVFERITRKDRKTFRNDMLAFSKKIKIATTSDTSSKFPLPFTLQKISFADLHVGDIVAVTAADSILSESTFTATRVSVQTSP